MDGGMMRMRDPAWAARWALRDRLPWFGPPLIASIRLPLYHPDFPLILLWSQKSGCTTVVTWFLAQLGLLEEAKAHSSWIHRYENEVFKARPGYAEEVASALRSGRHHVVKVVRDPLARAASAFLVLGERGAVLERPHWTKRHWSEAEEWLARRGADPVAGISFLDHLAMVAEFERWRPHAIDRHLSGQHVRGERAVLDELVPIERFDTWTVSAAAAHGLRPIDPASLATPKHHHRVDAERTAALGPCPERVPISQGAFSDGRFPAASAFVNERSIGAIRSAYSQDLRAYGALYGLSDPPRR